jgi:hypothetical protein
MMAMRDKLGSGRAAAVIANAGWRGNGMGYR